MRALSSELARRALDAAPDAMLIVDSSATIQFANEQVAALFGHLHDELIGQPIETLIPQRFRSQHVTHRDHYLAAAHLRPMGQGLDLFALRKDGTEFPVEISLSPLQDTDRMLFAASIRDVTERKRVETELRNLQSITDTALSSESSETLIRALLNRLRTAIRSDTTTILLVDADGQHLTPFASDGMEAELGGELKVPLGQGVAGRLALSECPLQFEDLSRIKVVSPILRSRVRSLVGTRLTSRGQLVGVIHAGSSAPRKFTEDEIHLLMLAAERIGMAIERARLYELEQIARRAAEAANQAKSRFLATASHDLRQPLQTLALLHGTLRRIALDSLAADVLEQQEQALNAMSRLLNALLDISKLDSGAIKPDPSDFLVNELFEELRREFASLAQDKGLELKVASCQQAVHSDPTLVGQILRNLLTNAIKYTREGWVALQCTHSPAFVRLEVVDTGIGIPANQLRHIYDEFYQVGVPANAARDGYGLGLSIVQRLVTLLDVKLDVQSEVQQGSMFALTLPVGGAMTPHAIARAKITARAERTPARILLVEDDQAVRNATCMLLRSEGFQVVAVASLKEALTQVAGNPQIDLLVTDFHLQDGERGTDVIVAVRAALDRQLKAILVTGDTSSAIAELTRDRLMRVTSKPVNAEALVSLLKELLASNY